MRDLRCDLAKRPQGAALASRPAHAPSSAECRAGSFRTGRLQHGGEATPAYRAWSPGRQRRRRSASWCRRGGVGWQRSPPSRSGYPRSRHRRGPRPVRYRIASIGTRLCIRLARLPHPSGVRRWRVRRAPAPLSPCPPSRPAAPPTAAPACRRRAPRSHGGRPCGTRRSAP